MFDKDDQVVGIRFAGVAIPQGATITAAYIQFQADETQSEATALTFQAEAIDNAPAFVNSTNNITSRVLITAVQETFKGLFNAGDDFVPDGSQFDHLFEDEERFHIGEMEVRVMHTPGHTPACVTYVVGDAAFVGDTMFMPDFGTARADFPGGDAAVLYRSIRNILELAPETRLFMCHDYKAPGRDEFAWETTVAKQRAGNVHIRDGVGEQEFIEFRTGRDAGLGMPKLILPSIQVNIRAGEMPPPDHNGVVYLKLPVDAL